MSDPLDAAARALAHVCNANYDQLDDVEKSIWQVRADAAVTAFSEASSTDDDERWRPWLTVPRDGSWIIALCNDLNVIRVSWGLDRSGDETWCSQQGSYGDTLFCGWKPFDRMSAYLRYGEANETQE